MPGTPTGKTFGTDLRSGRRVQLQNTGSPSQMAQFLYPMAFRETIFQHYDFLEDSLNLDFWNLTKDSGGTDFAVNPAVGGSIEGTAGTTNGEGIGIYGPALYKGDLNCGMEVRMKLDVVTNSIIEVGWADGSVSDHKDPVVNDVDTPTVTNNLTDGAVIHRHTGQTLTAFALVGVGSTPYSAQKSSLGQSPSADTFFTLRVQLFGDNAYGAMFGATQEKLAETMLTSAIEGGTLVRPFVSVSRVSTANKVATIDYITLWQDRF